MPGVDCVAGVKTFVSHTRTFLRSLLTQIDQMKGFANSVTLHELRCETQNTSLFVTIRKQPCGQPANPGFGSLAAPGRAFTN